MENASTTKVWLLGLLGAVGAFISNLFGGWDAALTTLLIFMAIDYLSGIVVAGVFKKSGKSETGALEGRAGLKGICKKGMMLLVVLVAVRLDMMSGTNFLRDAVIIAFVANEALSIMENAGLMGVKWPPVISNAIDVLKKKGESG